MHLQGSRVQFCELCVHALPVLGGFPQGMQIRLTATSKLPTVYEWVSARLCAWWLVIQVIGHWDSPPPNRIIGIENKISLPQKLHFPCWKICFQQCFKLPFQNLLLICVRLISLWVNWAERSERRKKKAILGNCYDFILEKGSTLIRKLQHHQL